MSHKGRPELPTSPERRAAFLEALANSGGNFNAACRAVAPHLDQNVRPAPGYSTWRAVIARDPEFAAAYEAVMDEVKAEVEQEIFRRAQVGVLEPVFQKGQQATDADGNPAYIRRYSDRLLLKRAAALMPDKYSDRREININHNVRSAISWAITGDDLALLTAEEKADLTRIVQALRSRRAEIAHTARLEDQRAEAIEVDYEEVEETEYSGNEEDPIPW